ncbi:NUDIX domain-containing protein [Natronoarchaeum philippinense]|uniref:NUDIX domain-containing protein n=1 Tax=Natronoarchaeum philippinense TaxID=558529 RepID=A0A285N9V5_NATPI|nr:NUDIX domain-containing protein [Natronoarchaeum philippinense]SNZ06078.1 NUDIX domain-containing protein [Natronoarchaeum philippinense]
MTFDELWYLANEAEQRAEQARHRLASEYDEYLEFERTRRVSRPRFRTLAERIQANGTPYGAHTIVYRPSGELLLVRHETVDLWVLPGGGVRADESFREAAEREVAEEAGVEVSYDGLAMLTDVRVVADDATMRGVLPVFAGRAETTTPSVSDPDDEISAARWFAELPADTRDRDEILTWREQALSA